MNIEYDSFLKCVDSTTDTRLQLIAHFVLAGILAGECRPTYSLNFMRLTPLEKFPQILFRFFAAQFTITTFFSPNGRGGHHMLTYANKDNTKMRKLKFTTGWKIRH